MTKALLRLYLAVLAFLSLNPWFRPSGDMAPGTAVGWDKLDHALAYAGLTALLMLAFGRRLRGWRLALAAVLVSASLGILLEYCQEWFTVYRQGRRAG